MTEHVVMLQVQDEYTLIGKGLFKKETNMQLFVGLKLERSSNGEC